MAVLIDEKELDWARASPWQPRQPAWPGPRVLILATASMHLSDEAPRGSERGHSIRVEGPGLAVRVGASPADLSPLPKRAASTTAQRGNPPGITLSAARDFTAESNQVLDAMADALADAIADEMAIEYLIATGALKQP